MGEQSAAAAALPAATHTDTSAGHPPPPGQFASGLARAIPSPPPGRSEPAWRHAMHAVLHAVHAALPTWRSTFRILPRSGSTAWVRLSRACLVLPPAQQRAGRGREGGRPAGRHGCACLCGLVHACSVHAWPYLDSSLQHGGQARATQLLPACLPGPPPPNLPPRGNSRSPPGWWSCSPANAPRHCTSHCAL